MRWLIAALGIAVAGCNSNPFCLNCGTSSEDLARPIDGGADGEEGRGDGGDLAGGGDLASTDLTALDLWGVDGLCFGKNLNQDPNNCGVCGRVCSYTHAFGVCTNGNCEMGACVPGYFDIDENAANGCELSCTLTKLPPTCQSNGDCTGVPCTNGYCAAPCTDSSGDGSGGGCPQNQACRDVAGQKVCLGDVCDYLDNNCNQKTDEGFDLTSDAANCGQCGNICRFSHATSSCTNSACTVKACEDGYRHLPSNPGSGCEYKCPVWPTTSEVCNGDDDNCDGVIDDSVTDVGQPCDDYCPQVASCIGTSSCSYALSSCAGSCCGICTRGAVLCAGGQKVCQAGGGPSLEVCNGQDDNCDGQIDEGFDRMNDPLNCGSCGHACNLANAVSRCVSGQCEIAVCLPGFSDVDKNQPGCEYPCPVNPPTIESCNGLDDDCNGTRDDGVPVPANFCNQMVGTPCAGATVVCGGAKGWICSYGAGAEVDANGNLLLTEKLCDDQDGNCNTQIDESFPNKGKSCSAGIGRCQGTATFQCSVDHLTTTCPAVANPGAAIAELCNGVDDNCDGQIDERNPQNGVVLAGWKDAMVQIGSSGVYVYAYEASRPDSTASAVGTNAARACSKSGVLPWAPVTHEQAAAACAAILDSNGQPMRLCTAAEWSTACSLGRSDNPIWSYSTNPTVYNGAACNGVDKGLGRTWTTGAGQATGCFVVAGAANLYDMSGNLWEWTSTQVVDNNTVYYKVRGGAYNTLSLGTNCQFDFTIAQGPPGGGGYQYSDLGFRCCADSPP